MGCLCAREGPMLQAVALVVPSQRSKHPVFRTARAIWTAPTNLLGHGVARAAGCRAAARIGGPAARAWLYYLPEGRANALGAVAVGHVIIAAPKFLEKNRAWILAHELSHTRQHDWLGPLYLPLHALAQLVSVALTTVRPVPGYSRQHAHNPLERRLLCVPFDVLAERTPHGGPGDAGNPVLAAFGLREPTR